MVADIILSDDQQNAFNTIIAESGPFFVTGKAGTGKSALIRYMKSSHKVRCAAYTGLAAQNIGGSTLHSLFGLSPQSRSINPSNIVTLGGRLSGFDFLVIDEISMVPSWLFDLIYKALKTINFRGKLVLVGDFLQLQPVDGRMAFTSNNWSAIKKIELTEQHRQNNIDFLRVLDEIRFGNFTEDVAGFIASKIVNNLPDDCVNLISVKKTVEAINEMRVQQLPGELYIHKSKLIHTIVDQQKTNYFLENTVRFPSLLKLKVGARIVMLKNDPDKLFVNGTLGRILDIDKAYDCILVRADAGYDFRVGVTREDIIDADERIVLSHEQYPLQLAYAMTIHKSQGMTLEKVGVDLTNHFSGGMTYVAISRAKSPEGISFVGRLYDLKVNQEAMRYYKGIICQKDFCSVCDEKFDEPDLENCTDCGVLLCQECRKRHDYDACISTFISENNDR